MGLTPDDAPLVGWLVVEVRMVDLHRHRAVIGLQHIDYSVSEIWVQLGCNNTSRELLWAPEVAIGTVKLQLVTSGDWTVTAEVASSSLVVPAILFLCCAP
jgi:hypothetical protein